eukprot:5271589-Pyramimonas_sp.AAC.1
MAGPTNNLELGWGLIRRSGIEIDPPTPYDHYLGCGQDAWQVPQRVFAMHDTKQYTSASNVRGVRHDLLGFAD